MAAIGYGFDKNSISSNDLLRFFLKYNDKERISDMIEETLSERKDVNKLTESEMERLADSVAEWIEEGDGESIADYIADMINSEERISGRMHEQDVVTAYDDYIVFEVVMFPGDKEERLKRIKTKEDFCSMIEGYFPCSELVFGPVYDNLEFADRFYWIGSDD